MAFKVRRIEILPTMTALALGVVGVFAGTVANSAPVALFAASAVACAGAANVLTLSRRKEVTQ